MAVSHRLVTETLPWRLHFRINMERFADEVRVKRQEEGLALANGQVHMSWRAWLQVGQNPAQGQLRWCFRIVSMRAFVSLVLTWNTSPARFGQGRW